MPGVISHIANPDPEQAVGLATSAEAAGATWIGLADAFWWRDVWMLLGEVARSTDRIEVGPAMTNPYMRHFFHTAAALATLQELAPGRVFCGIAAGGSELTAAAGIPRGDAAGQVGSLVAFLREVTATQILDADSGRNLDVALDQVPILVAGRGDGMLRAAGETADRVLLWAIPASDLERSVSVIRDGGRGRSAGPDLIWAPLVRHDDAPEESIMHVAVYATLNTAAEVRADWGFDDGLVAAMRSELVRGDLPAAAALVPRRALDDLVFEDTDPAPLAEVARTLGVSSLAVPGFAVEAVGAHVRWAASVEALLT